MLPGLHKTSAHSKRHYGFVMAFAIVGVGVLFVAEPLLRSFVYQEPAVSLTTQANAPSLDNGVLRSQPTRLVIPSINLDANFVTPLGLLPDQTVSVPDSYTEVGWYSGGVTPGEIGPSVILGHVDSKSGPGVFYSLGQLNIGDDIEITREDGTTVTFVVTKLERHPQSNFPTLAVYGPTDEPTLRLVTCTGAYNRGVQRYSHNLVVYAKIK